MEKKYLIIGGAIFILLILGITFFLVFSSGQKGSGNTQIPNADTYEIQIDYENSKIAASVLINGKIYTINSDQDLRRFAITSINRTNDVIWALCAENYKLSNSYSPTQNKITIDPLVGTGMEIKSGQKNQLILDCNK